MNDQRHPDAALVDGSLDSPASERRRRSLPGRAVVAHEYHVGVGERRLIDACEQVPDLGVHRLDHRVKVRDRVVHRVDVRVEVAVAVGCQFGRRAVQRRVRRVERQPDEPGLVLAGRNPIGRLSLRQTAMADGMVTSSPRPSERCPGPSSSTHWRQW